jgi:hypothetical protein
MEEKPTERMLGKKKNDASPQTTNVCDQKYASVLSNKYKKRRKRKVIK